MRRDVFSPWLEDAAQLRSETVGRRDVLTAIAAAVSDAESAPRAGAFYVYGPRGVGKSHVTVLARLQLGGRWPDYWLAEDLPTYGHASALIERLGDTTPPRAFLVFEGLDRQLGAMSRSEQLRLREFLEARPGWLVLATGVKLDEALVGHDMPFFQFFSSWPLRALNPDEATALLDAAVPSSVRGRSGWAPTRDTIVRLSAGSPRLLHSLAQVAAAREDDQVADHLELVIQSFIGHFQQRFRDLSPSAQVIFEALALAPGPLTVSRVVQSTRLEQSTASKSLTGLFLDGLVDREEVGRTVRYGLSEPLFRFWYEYRTAPWNATRVGWTTRLLQDLATGEDLVRWLGAPQSPLAEAAESVLRQRPERVLEVAQQLGGRDPAVGEGVQRRIRALPEATVLDLVRVVHRAGADPKPLVKAFSSSFPHLSVAWSFASAVRATGRAATSLRTLIARLDGLDSSSTSAPVWRGVAAIVQKALEHVAPQGREITLTLPEREKLTRLPALRRVFLSRGRHPAHQPLMPWDDLLGTPLPHLEVDFSELATSAPTPVLSALIREARRLPKLPTVGRGGPLGFAVPSDLTGDEMLSFLRRAADEGQPVTVTLHPRVLGATSQPVFDAYCRWLAGQKVEGPFDSGPLLLTVAATGRFAPLAVALLAGRPDLRTNVERAMALVQAIHGDRATLYPELQLLGERVRDFGSAKPASP